VSSAGRRGLAVSALVYGLPGSPYLFEGEELGLDEAEVPAELKQDPWFLRTGGEHPGRDGCRTPIPWDSTAPGLGFTTASPGCRSARTPPAVPWTCRRPTRPRRCTPTGGCSPPGAGSSRPACPDEVELLDTAPDVLAFRRGSLVVVLNTAAEPVEVEAGAASLLEATADGASVDGGVVTVPSAATVWLTADPSRSA
jgi:alpha-glucosidase